MNLLKGKPVSKAITENLKREIMYLADKGIIPKLVVLSVEGGSGDGGALESYLRSKVKLANRIGAKIEHVTVRPEKLREKLRTLSSAPDVHGIMLYLPLPPNLNLRDIVLELDPDKDLDGLHPLNYGMLIYGNDQLEMGLCSCTAEAVVRLLDWYRIPIEGKHVVLVGRSPTVGRPLIQMLLNRNATLTITHSKTPDLKRFTVEADLLIVAVGRPRLIGAEYVKDGAVIVDVGTNVVDGKLIGDVDFESVKMKVSAITPVPGGVGPVTTAIMMEHLVKSARRLSKI